MEIIWSKNTNYPVVPWPIISFVGWTSELWLPQKPYLAEFAAVLSSMHCIAVFSRESMSSGLAERLSVVLHVPVVPNDGLSTFADLALKVSGSKVLESASQG